MNLEVFWSVMYFYCIFPNYSEGLLQPAILITG